MKTGYGYPNMIMYVCSATVPNIQSSGRTELRQDTQGEKVELGDGRQSDTVPLMLQRTERLRVKILNVKTTVT